jgi:hypothetical protein
MRIRLMMMTALIALNGPSLASAHGPQLQITIDAGRIVTRNILIDSPYAHLTAPKSAYVMPLLEYDGAWYSRPNGEMNALLDIPVYFSGPGLAYGYDQDDGGPRLFDDGTALLLNFADGLKRWDGTAFVDPGSEQVQAFRGSAGAPSALAVTSDSGPFESLAFPPIPADYGVDAHSSARFRLLGDDADPLGSSQDGVYLLSLSISSTQAGLAESDEFYFVLHKNTQPADLAAAVSSLELDAALVQIVPEPSPVALIAGITACIILIRCVGPTTQERMR